MYLIIKVWCYQKIWEGNRKSFVGFNLTQPDDHFPDPLMTPQKPEPDYSLLLWKGTLLAIVGHL